MLLDLTALTTLADYFVICSGGSERQLDAIADGIVSALRDEKTKPFGREGTPISHWVLLDYGSVVVHILTPRSATTTASRSTGRRRRRSCACSDRRLTAARRAARVLRRRGTLGSCRLEGGAS